MAGPVKERAPGATDEGAAPIAGNARSIPWTRAVDGLWRALNSRWLLAGAVLLLLLLLLAQRWLPQAPGQVAEDPAAAVRWRNVQRDQWGWAGPLLLALGLFDVDSSPIFFAAVALAGLAAALQLADALDGALLPARLRRAFDAETAWVDAAGPLYRARVAVARLPADALAEVHARLREAGLPVVEQSPPPAQVAGDGSGGGEVRILAARGVRARRLRPLLPAGLLLALAALWVGALFGWEVQADALAPGDVFVYAPHSVAFTYTLPAADAGAPGAPALEVSIRGRNAMLGAGEYARVADARTRVTEGVAALLVQAERPLLARPGESNARAAVGLAFPQEGSEEFLLLPAEDIGLRLVRLGGQNAGSFLVEIFAEDDVQPVERLQIAEDAELTVPVPGSEPLRLQVAVLPALDVRAVRAPGQWLYWPALGLALVGLAGWLMRPAFALVQVDAWPVERTLLTVQADQRALVERLVVVEADAGEE